MSRSPSIDPGTRSRTPRHPLACRSPHRRLLIRVADTLIIAVASTALLMIALIFVFLGREALPVALGQVNSALVQPALPVESALALPPEALRSYLGLTPGEYARLDAGALRQLAELKLETQERIPENVRRDPDATVNTAQWRYLVLPHAWTGHEVPAFVWQPIAWIRKYNLVPLLVGSFKVTLVALAFALPLALAAALYVAHLAPRRVRNWIKPGIELLAAVPSIAIGFLALVVLASLLQGPIQWGASALGWPASRLNAAVAGVALGLALIPVIFTIAEDALAAVPRPHLTAAHALGATRWQAAWQVAVPAALPGLFAAVLLGFGRAMGDTMIVLLASGNAALMSWNIFQPARTLTATIAAEMAEAVFGGQHYRMLFLLGTLLLAITFLSNLVADSVLHRLKARLAGIQ